jgi:hypothetical protein
MTITATFSEQLSEQWLLERTCHAQLHNGRELSVPDLTRAMKQLIDFSASPCTLATARANVWYACSLCQQDVSLFFSL